MMDTPPTLTDPTPAALYARVSSDRQDVDLSISAQLRRYLQKVCKQSGGVPSL